MNDTMKTSQNGLEFISKWEGCVLKPYRDIAGLRTIGIGHLILQNENFPDGVEITKEKALEILSKDLEKCEIALKQSIKVQLTQEQFDALISFGFNCGVGVYNTSTACKLLNQGDYESVPEKLLDWSKVKIKGVMQVNQGLYNRRKAEGDLFSGKRVSAETVKWDKETLRSAQEKLQKLGLYASKVDGIWGPMTSSAFASFAKSAGVSLGSNPSQEIPKALFDLLLNV